MDKGGTEHLLPISKFDICSPNDRILQYRNKNKRISNYLKMQCTDCLRFSYSLFNKYKWTDKSFISNIMLHCYEGPSIFVKRNLRGIYCLINPRSQMLIYVQLYLIMYCIHMTNVHEF